MDLQAIFDNYRRTITEHYFDMNGRVGRPQFWYFVLANFVAAILADIVGRIVLLPVGQLYNLAVLLPAMASERGGSRIPGVMASWSGRC